MEFYLGTHMVNWLSRTDVPLFISHRRLQRVGRLPRARGPVAIDSGAFTELALHGRFRESPHSYARAVRRYHDKIGRLTLAAPQDLMCEPEIRARTGLSVAEHQHRTVENYCLLRSIAPDLPFIPVVQGWSIGDYEACLAMYEAAGVDLTTEPRVGVGSVCRRQGSGEIEAICRMLAGADLRLHGFGIKLLGCRYSRFLASADSLAWSFHARRSPPLPGHTHASCVNCLTWALQWRDRVVRRADTQQLALWDS